MKPSIGLGRWFCKTPLQSALLLGATGCRTPQKVIQALVTRRHPSRYFSGTGSHLATRTRTRFGEHSPGHPPHPHRETTLPAGFTERLRIPTHTIWPLDVRKGQLGTVYGSEVRNPCQVASFIAPIYPPAAHHPRCLTLLVSRAQRQAPHQAQNLLSRAVATPRAPLLQYLPHPAPGPHKNNLRNTSLQPKRKNR